MGLKVPRWNRLPNKTSIFGFYLQPFLYFFIYIFSWTCNISSNLYKLPCLWGDIFIFVISCTFCCKYVEVTLFALFPHLSGSTFGSTTFVDNFLQILGRFITLLIFASQGSITNANNVLYLTSHSFALRILDMVYYIISRVWNCVGSFNNNNSSSTTFATWSNCLCKLWVNIWFTCVAILPLLFGNSFAINLNPYNNSFF